MLGGLGVPEGCLSELVLMGLFCATGFALAAGLTLGEAGKVIHGGDEAAFGCGAKQRQSVIEIGIGLLFSLEAEGAGE